MRLRLVALAILIFSSTCTPASGDTSLIREQAIEKFFNFLSEIACTKGRKFCGASCFYDNQNKILVRFFEGSPGVPAYKIFETSGLQAGDAERLCFFCVKVLDDFAVRKRYTEEMGGQPQTFFKLWQHHQQKTLQN